MLKKKIYPNLSLSLLIRVWSQSALNASQGDHYTPIPSRNYREVREYVKKNANFYPYVQTMG